MMKLTIAILLFFSSLSCGAQKSKILKRPNILFVISDDQSFASTSFAGSTFIKTPAFDRVAKEGIYFANCIAGSPGCAPSRGSIVTGRYPWQNEQSGQHASAWLKKYIPFIDVLKNAGYSIGRTGKGVDPFQYARDGKDSLWRNTNAAGILHSDIKYNRDSLNNMQDYASGITTTDYFGNFRYFIENVKKEQPFFFWFGAREPHRSFEKNSYKKVGKHLNSVTVPKFLPDNAEIRGDLLDYAVEVEWFDKQLNHMLDYLEDIGELENTVVIVTSDNGKAFPSAKANAYEYGIHVPLAIRYPKDFPGGRIIKDPVSFVDLAPTILNIVDEQPEGMMPITGKSFLSTLQSKEGFPKRKNINVYSGRERHSSSRYNNWGYPQRALRSKDYLLIWNMKPDRWPAGAPQELDPNYKANGLPLDQSSDTITYVYGNAYTDIDDSPTKDYILKHAAEEVIKPYFLMAVGKRPEFELFDINKDPYCLNNLVDDPKYARVGNKLKTELVKELKKTKDPRVVGKDREVFDSYKRYSHIRKFPKPDDSELDLKSKR